MQSLLTGALAFVGIKGTDQDVSAGENSIHKPLIPGEPTAMFAVLEQVVAVWSHISLSFASF
jgi:hypothetical protein